MISRLASREQMRVLAAAPDMDGALRQLLETPYRAMIARLLESEAPLSSVERLLVESMVDAYQRTARLFRGPAARLVAEMARSMELDNLKAILRSKTGGDPSVAVQPLLVPLGALSRLPTTDLLRAEAVDGMTSVLAGTPYGRALRDALPRYQAERSLLPLEIALDLSYYRTLWSAVQGLPEPDLRIAARLVGIRFDVLNIEWIIRYRLVYSLSPEEIFNYTLPFGLRIDNTVVRRAASVEGIEQIASVLPEPYRSTLSPMSGAADAVERAELELQRHLVHVSRLALAGYPFHIGAAIAYLWLKEAEVHDLTAILEAKRYRLTGEEITLRLWSVS